MELVAFNTLLDREDVVAESLNPDYALGDAPVWLERFMLLTMMCSSGEPEQDVPGGGYLGSGCCVFYVKSADWGEPGRYEPWTCEITLGGSLSFDFQRVGRSGTDCSYSEADGWSVPEDGRRPTLDDMHWQPDTLDMLARSVWPVLRTPAQARAQQKTAPEHAGA